MTRWRLFFLCVLAAVHVAAAGSAFDGQWYWQGSAGWQKIVLNLKANGNAVNGFLRMGPGEPPKGTPAEDWELFFEPAEFQIANGRIDGNRISFEQPVMRGAGTLPIENLKYSGTLDGDHIAFTRESVQRPKDASILGNHKVEFVVERTSAVPHSTVTQLQQPVPNPTLPSRRISFTADVLGADGKPVQNLDRSSFEVLDDGMPMPIQSFAQSTTPLNVLLLFDRSQTWFGDSATQNASGYGVVEWKRLLDASTHFLDHLRQGDRLALGEFESNVRIALDWWVEQLSAPHAVSFKLREPPTGQTDLYGAVTWSVSKFAMLGDRKIAILFTDGRDGRLNPRWLRPATGRGSSVPVVGSEGIEVLDPLFGLDDAAESAEFEKLLQMVAQSGIQFYFVAINSDRDPEFGPSGVGRRISGLFPGTNEGIESYLDNVRRRLNRIAAVSGGRVFYGDSPIDGETIFANLHHQIGIGSYSFSITPPNPTDDRYHRIELRVSDPMLRVFPSIEGYR